MSIFEYFEALCWKEMQKNILFDYKLELSEDIKNYINEYFNKLTEDKLINKEKFTNALRRLISRSLAGSRQDIDIKSEAALKLYMTREDLWSKETMDNILFDGEIDEICKDNITIGHCFNLYNLLDGDSILNALIYRAKENNKDSDINNNKFDQNDNQDGEDNKNGDDDEDNEDDEEEERDDNI